MYFLLSEVELVSFIIHLLKTYEQQQLRNNKAGTIC